MRSKLLCLTDTPTAHAGPEAEWTPDRPCQVAVNAVLDILEMLLSQRARAHDGALQIDEVRQVFDQVKQAPGHLNRLYEEAHERCRMVDDAAAGAPLRPIPEPGAAAAAPATTLPGLGDGPGGSRRAVGRLQTIGLRGVREKLGKRWGEVADRVRNTALAVIRRVLAPNDTFLCNGEGDFIICFAELRDEEAWLKAKAIEQEIRERLLGSEGDGELEDLDLDFGTLTDIADLESETYDLELAGAGIGPGADVGALVAAKLEEASRQIREQIREHLVKLEETWAIDLRDVHVASGAPARMLIAEPDRATRMALSRLRLAARRDPELLANLDLLALGAAAELLAGETVLGNALLAVEVNASTVMRRANYDLFREACQTMKDEVRDQLVLVVGGLPGDAYMPAVADALRLLKGFSRVTALRLPAPRLDGFDLRAAGVRLVFLAQATAAATLHRKPATFDRFLRELHGSGGRLLVDRVSRPETLEPLIGAGIELWTTAGS